MTVADYYNDMILGQKWAVEVETTLVHCGADYYETDGEGNAVMKSTEPFEDVCVETFHFSVPCGRCSYFKNEVRYFRVIDNEIYLCVKDFKEI